MNPMKSWAAERLGSQWATQHRSDISDLLRSMVPSKETLLDVAPVRLGAKQGLLAITTRRIVGIHVGLDCPLKQLAGLAVGPGAAGDGSFFQLKLSTPTEELPLQVPIEFRERFLESLRSALPHHDADTMRSSAIEFTRAQAAKKKAKQADADAKLVDDAKGWAVGALIANVLAYLTWDFFWPPVAATIVVAIAWSVANDNKDSKGNVIRAGQGLRGTAMAIAAVNWFLIAVDQGWIS